MKITLDKELRALLEAKIASGEYDNASEVVANGLRVLFQQEVASEDAEVLRILIAEGLDDVERGNIHDGEEVFRELAEEVALKRRR